MSETESQTVPSTSRRGLRTDAWAASFEVIEDHDDRPSNRSGHPSIDEVIVERLTRRGVLKAALAAAAGAAIPVGTFACGSPGHGGTIAGAASPSGPSTLGFDEIPAVITATDNVSPGYTAQPLIRWGDPVFEGAPVFRPGRLSGDEQAHLFGYNCDFIAYMPLPRGSENSDHGLLCVNHEYTCAWLMWSQTRSSLSLTPERVETDMAAHGHTVMEVRRGADGAWVPVVASRFNRRIMPTTAMRIGGPGAGHRRMRTEADPMGRSVFGTVNNCAGGVTPWGTVLVAEENFNKYFVGDPERVGEESANHTRYGLGTAEYDWRSADERFDLEKHPREPNRFGWVVEFDPYDPESVPVKRTALGRIKHEGSTTVIDARTKRLVVYMGDDQRFEYVYRFVSDRPVDLEDPEHNEDLLDEGVLSVARFNSDGTMRWLPLVYGEGPLTEANGFDSQGEVLIDTRRAADLLGATPMDRPEDVEPNPTSGKVYAMLTNNSRRTEEQLDAANPRAENLAGHIIEIVPPGAAEGSPESADHVSSEATWEIFLRAGDPGDDEVGAVYHPDVSKDGWLACPDNCAFDHKGRMWIATDQGSKQASFGIPDGLRATDTAGPGRALTKLFYACPTGAELCGPCFTPDARTVFVAVQHPGDDRGSTFDAPSTRWPNSAGSDAPPLPTVVAITKDDGGEIGS
ncbi:MAG: PhoX family phosphatase [Planctomycetota bacterium]